MQTRTYILVASFLMYKVLKQDCMIFFLHVQMITAIIRQLPTITEGKYQVTVSQI